MEDYDDDTTDVFQTQEERLASFDEDEESFMPEEQEDSVEKIEVASASA